MPLGSLLKLLFSQSAFLKAELDHIEAKRKAGEAYSPAEVFRSEALTRIKAKRRRLLVSVIWIVILVAVGGMAALVVNAVSPMPWFWIRMIRAFSVLLLAWAVWSKLGDIETFKGETLLELTSQSLYRVAYSVGILIGSFALFLDGYENGTPISWIHLLS
ncbi:MAG: hypothetical protein RLQ25_10790 [Alphaproteobacteria bacterium]